MGCCGARAKQPAKGQAPTFVGLPGAGGMVKVEYLGKESFPRPGDPQRGTITGTYYHFGPDKPKGYVDKEDAATLLELSENDEKLFRLLGSVRTPKPPPEISSVVRGIGATMVRKRAQEA